MKRPLSFLALLAATAVGAPSCQKASNHQRLTVFAAASLTDAFLDLKDAFEAEHPTRIALNFAGSQVLRLQLEQGAEADVVATANAEHMNALARSAVVQRPSPFATTPLCVITPRDNPAAIASLDDLPNARRIVIGTPKTPIGAYTRQLLTSTPADFRRRVLARVASEEANTRLVRAKVELGDADAAVVYCTDASSTRPLQVIPIARPRGVQARLLIAPTKSGHTELAERWIRFLRSPRGQTILRRHGFTPTQAPSS